MAKRSQSVQAKMAHRRRLPLTKPREHPSDSVSNDAALALHKQQRAKVFHQLVDNATQALRPYSVGESGKQTHVCVVDLRVHAESSSVKVEVAE